MPTYEYQCKGCHDQFEIKQSFTDPSLTKCEKCGADLKKVFGNIGITFKGSGFYKTDSRSGTSTKAGTASGSESGNSSSDESSAGTGSGSKSSDSGEPASKTPASKTSDTKQRDTRTPDTKTPDSRRSDAKAKTSSFSGSTP